MFMFKIKIFGKNFCMSKFKLINILDKVFIAFTLFLILFALIQFFVGSFGLSLFLSLVVTASFLCVFHFVKRKIYNTKQAKQVATLEAESCYLNFAMMSTQRQLSLIKKFVPAEKCPVIKSGHIECKNQIVVVAPSSQELNKNAFVDCIKNCWSTKKEIVIFANSFSTDTIDFAKTLNKKIILLDKNNFYLLCENNKITFKNNFKNIEKIKFKDIFINFFDKKHAKGFFFSGFVLIFTSFIIPFKNYYLIFGIILLIFSLVCKIKKSPKFEEFKF